VEVPLVTTGVFGAGGVFQVEYCQCLNGLAATLDKRVSRLSPEKSFTSVYLGTLTAHSLSAPPWSQIIWSRSGSQKVMTHIFHVLTFFFYGNNHSNTWSCQICILCSLSPFLILILRGKNILLHVWECLS